MGRSIPQDGPLLGYVERADREIIVGWAALESHPCVPVRLEVVNNGVVIAEVLAKQYRTISKPQALAVAGTHSISSCRGRLIRLWEMKS